MLGGNRSYGIICTPDSSLTIDPLTNFPFDCNIGDRLIRHFCPFIIRSYFLGISTQIDHLLIWSLCLVIQTNQPLPYVTLCRSTKNSISYKRTQEIIPQVVDKDGLTQMTMLSFQLDREFLHRIVIVDLFLSFLFPPAVILELRMQN